jgi:hypothetical protein
MRAGGITRRTTLTLLGGAALYAALPSWPTRAAERQEILEAIDVETRLRRLVKFLLAEIRRSRNGDAHE